MESKAITGLKNLDMEKTGFREWFTKLKNNFSQARPGHMTRWMWKWTEKKAIRFMKDKCSPEDYDVGYEEEDLPTPSELTQEFCEEFSEDVMAVLTEKTEGELNRRVIGTYTRCGSK